MPPSTSNPSAPGHYLLGTRATSCTRRLVTVWIFVRLHEYGACPRCGPMMIVRQGVIDRIAPLGLDQSSSTPHLLENVMLFSQIDAFCLTCQMQIPPQHRQTLFLHHGTIDTVVARPPTAHCAGAKFACHGESRLAETRQLAFHMRSTPFSTLSAHLCLTADPVRQIILHTSPQAVR